MLKPLGNNILARFLAGIYGLIVSCRNAWYDRHPGFRTGHLTISVGGIHAGGTGKTPVAIMLGEHFSKAGRDVALLSRGYKRINSRPIIAEPGEKQTWDRIGDEPVMFQQAVPKAWLGIGANRKRNAKEIAGRLRDNAVIILDDGFQHRSVHRDIDIVCLPADLFADYLIPAGFLREPKTSLSRAHAICLIGSEQ
jgi:tetraacyldisaccharide 4'-kinase